MATAVVHRQRVDWTGIAFAVALTFVIVFPLVVVGTWAFTEVWRYPSIIPQPTQVGAFTIPVESASQRVLAADATLSAGADEANRQNNNYINVQGGYQNPIGTYKPHTSPHLQGPLPSGGNLVMLDGHVEWRKFRLMHVRTTAAPYFWW